MRKLLRLLFIFCVSLYSGHAFSQISHGGAPVSFDQNFNNYLKTNIPTITMPLVNEGELRAEDIVNDLKKDIPWRFGQNISVQLNLKNSGTWDILPNGSKLWRLRIFSPGALSINLIFDKYILPDGASLFIYNSNHSHVIGSFTKANNQTDKVFATTLVNGDAITLEYFEPAHAEFGGELSITNVTHGYRGPADFAEKAFGGSGACNVNVACPQAAGWENQIRSACMLVTGGSGFCSGALINNTNNDGTPYVLTANHCYSSPGSWVFWFNWQSSTCPNPGSSPSYQSISGAVLRARNTPSDFCLVEMNSAPPSGYNVYYSGWNRAMGDTITGTVFGIHHPSGDIKKISWSTLGTTTTTYLQNPVPGDGTHWRITTWSDGTTTEGGSSGSPLFDPQHRIIGQLHGGYASCSSITSDWYGKFGISWTGGGTSTNMLQPWLDPAGTNPEFIDGLDPNIPTNSLDASMAGILQPVNSYCGPNEISPAVIIKNLGSDTLTSLIVRYNFDGNTDIIENWTGSLSTFQTDTVYFPPVVTTSGTHIINVHISSPNSGTDQNSINDTTSDVFVVGNLQAPVGIGSVSCISSIMILTASGSGELHWFDSPVNGTDLGTGNTFTTPVLSTSTTYYVEDHILQSSQFVGPIVNTTGGGTNTAQSWLIFDCFSPVTLISVSVNANAAGNRLIQLKNSSGTVIQSLTVNIPAGVSRITLNFDIPVGTDLQLVGPASSGLYRINTGVTYPYEIPGLISIKNSNAGTGIYYYFFDWEVKEPDCISARTPVVAEVDTLPAYADFSYTSNQLDFSFTNLSTGTSQYHWDFGDGNTSTLQNPIHSYLTAGNYTVVLLSSDSCGSDTSTKTVTAVGNTIISNDFSSNIYIYPNPTSDYIYIDAENNGKLMIQIIDLLGKIVYYYTSDRSSLKQKIDISNLENGFYNILITFDNKIFETKLIKN